MSDLADHVLTYLDHLESSHFWEEVSANYSVDEVSEALLALLGAESSDVVTLSCLFIRDLVLMAPTIPGLRHISALFDAASVVPALEHLVRSDSLPKRDNAVYTLGKICSTSSVPHLVSVFEDIKDSDPLLLSRLALEIGWLGGAKGIPWIIATCCSPSFLTRWASLEILDDRFEPEPGTAEWQLKYEAIVTLAGDTNPHVAATAHFLQEEMDFEANLPNIATRAEKRRRRKELEKRRPQDFQGLSIAFRNWMYQNGSTTYTTHELSEFLRELPISS